MSVQFSTIGTMTALAGRIAAAAFYRLFDLISLSAFGKQQMLHYPFFQKNGQTLLEGQKNFTDVCLAKLGSITGKRLIEVGCGNGVQAIYIYDTYKPSKLVGVDLNPRLIRCATEATASLLRSGLKFAVDDAQTLSTLSDGTFDLLLCTESAHHYPDKEAFLSQVSRVLARGSHFVIADLVRRDDAKFYRFEPSFSYNHWKIDHYREALPRHGLRLEIEEELTKPLLAGLSDREAWFDDSGRTNLWRRIAEYVASLYARIIIYELNCRFRYILIAGVKA